MLPDALRDRCGIPSPSALTVRTNAARPPTENESAEPKEENSANSQPTSQHGAGVRLRFLIIVHVVHARWPHLFTLMAKQIGLVSHRSKNCRCVTIAYGGCSS